MEITASSSRDSADANRSLPSTPVIDIRNRMSSPLRQEYHIPDRTTDSLRRSFAEFSTKFSPSSAKNDAVPSSFLSGSRTRSASATVAATNNEFVSTPSLGQNNIMTYLNRDPQFKKFNLLTELGNRQRRNPWLILPAETAEYSIEELYELDLSTERQVNIHEKIVMYNAVILAMMLLINVGGVKFISNDFREIIGILLESYHSFRSYVMEMCEKNGGKAFYAGWHPLIKISAIMALKVGLFIGVKQVCKYNGTTPTSEMVNRLERMVIDFDKHPNEPQNAQGFGYLGTMAKFASVFMKQQDKDPVTTTTTVDDLESFMEQLPKVSYQNDGTASSSHRDSQNDTDPRR